MKHFILIFLCAISSIYAQDIYISSASNVLNENLSGIKFPRIAINGNEEPIILYGKSGDLYITIKSSNGFSEPINITENSPNSTNADSYGADIVTFNNHVYVSYQSASDIYLIHSQDNGSTWSEPIVPVEFPDHHVEFSKIGVDGNGNPRIVSIMANLNWSDPRQIVIYTNDGNNYSYTVANNETVNIVCECCQGEFIATETEDIVLYRDNDNDIRDIELAISENNSASYNTHQMIDFSGWYFPSCPVTGPEAIVVNNNIQAVWMSKGSGSSRVIAGTFDLGNLTAGENIRLDDNVGISVTQNYPQIAGNENFSAMLWQDNRYTFKNIFLSYSTDELNTVSNSILISDTTINGNSTGQAITLDQNGLFHICYVKSNNIVYHQLSLTTNVESNQEASFLNIIETSNNVYSLDKAAKNIQVFDVNGKLVKSLDNSKIINLEDVPKGNYIISIQDVKTSSLKLLVD